MKTVPIVLFFFFPICGFIFGQDKGDILSEEFRLNGTSVQNAFQESRTKALQGTVKLLRNDKLIALGTLVDPKGFVLTKASSCVGARIARLANGNEYKLKIRKRDESSDLALYQLITENPSFPHVEWSDANETAAGSWVLSAYEDLSEIRVGVMSGKWRSIGREGGVMGVLLRNQSAKAGVLITEVVPQAAADKAGVLMNDVIREIDGRKIVSSEQVVKIVSQKDPGDVVELSLDRKDKKLKLEVTLGHKSVTFELFNRNMQMSGPVSKRKDNFPMIFQHDIPLNKTAMGGPVFNLKGECLGLNIARVDRVTIFTLPSEIASSVVQDFLSQ